MLSHRGKRRLLWGPLGLSLGLLCTGEWLRGGAELVITPVDGGDPLLVAPLKLGERFTLHYIHSVDRAPIWEEYSVGPEGDIYIEKQRFMMFGAGMGHWPGHGTLTSRGKYQVIENIHKPLGEFVLRVGSQGVDHTIIWRDARLNLSRTAAGQAVRVSARPVSLRARLWRRLVSGTDALDDRRWETRS